MNIYIAIDLNTNGTPCTITTHDSLDGAKTALLFRIQWEAMFEEPNSAEWEEVDGYEVDGYHAPRMWYIKGGHENLGYIQNTILNNEV